MAAAPQTLKSHRKGPADARHTLEIFVDAVCPFSAKQLAGINEHLLPLMEQDRQKLKVVLCQNPQPWHASSTLTHEALLAASRLAPDSFWEYATALFKVQKQFYDEPTLDETPRRTRERLADLAHQTIGVDRQAFLDLILTGQGNSGTKVDPDLKLAIKYGRQNGIHVTPTLDGLIAQQISSSYGAEDWQKWFSDLS